jgi:4-hydroxyacetophenone monooxygenase
MNLATGANLFYHSEFQVHYTMQAIRDTLSLGARTCEVITEAHARYAERYQLEIGQMVWSPPSIKHSHYKNPPGKVFTLSPWPLDFSGEWTRQVDGNDYVLA